MLVGRSYPTFGTDLQCPPIAQCWLWGLALSPLELAGIILLIDDHAVDRHNDDDEDDDEDERLLAVHWNASGCTRWHVVCWQHSKSGGVGFSRFMGDLLWYLRGRSLCPPILPLFSSPHPPPPPHLFFAHYAVCLQDLFDSFSSVSVTVVPTNVLTLL